MALPGDFWWGAWVSSLAAEGAAPASDLGAWEREGRAAPSGEGFGFATGFHDDLRLLAAHGACHLALTLEWARVEPSDGHHDPAAVEQLRLQLEAARDAGISVWGGLQDGTLPGWFAHDERGHADDRSRRYYWARHVETTGELFGDLVHGWMPVHEPTRWAAQGWLEGARPPGRHDDAEAFAAALEGVHLASVEAAQRLRGGGRPVATGHRVTPLFPARDQPDLPPTPDAEAMTSVVDETLHGCWLRLLEEETLVVPGRVPVDVPGAREAFDVVGITYRHAAAVRGDGALLRYPQSLPAGAGGAVPWPEGLAIALHRVAEALPERPLLVAGYGLPTADEGLRERFLRDGLGIAQEAVADGMPLRGFWWQEPIDGPGHPAPPGLFDRDRTPRPAAALFAAVAAGADVPAGD